MRITCEFKEWTDRRCENRCEQGTLMTRDLRNRFEETDAWRGLAHEIEGDFGTISPSATGEESYADALDAYRPLEETIGIDRIIGWLSEDGFYHNVELLFEIADAIDAPIDESTRADLRSRSPTARVEFKRAHYDDLLEVLLECGCWP